MLAALARDPVAKSLHGLAVLVVEDDRDSRELLTEFFTDAGATCLTAASGNEAFKLFVEKRPDILVSDLWMSDGDGFALIRAIRSLPPGQGGLTPAIALSGGGTADQALMEGYHVLIPKPCDPTKVVEIIQEFLRTEEEGPSARAPWTLSSPASGTVVLTFAGANRATDVKACMDVLLRHLQRQPCEIIVDMRKVTGFSWAGASVAQRAIWSQRQSIRRVRLIGGSKSARLMAAGACRVLGLHYTMGGE